MSSLTKHIYHFEPGFPISLAFNRAFAERIHSNQEICQKSEFEDFFSRNINHITNTERWEYIVMEGSRQTASMVFCEEDDVHVGKCILVMFATNLGSSTLSGGYREAIRIAKEKNIKWLVYTKQITPYEHRVMYKEIR